MIRRNALIFHSGGLGDFILTWPLGLALGRLYPQSRITYVTHASKGRLANQVLGLDWRDAETGWPALYSDADNLNESCRRILEESHSIYTFLATEGDVFCRNIARVSPNAALVPLRLVPPFDGHVTEQLLGQLASVPAVQTATAQMVASIRNAGLGRGGMADGPILIHPGSGGCNKCWPGFLHLIERLDRREVRILLGEVELERFSGELLQQFTSLAPVAKPASYTDLFTEIAGAAAFVGNDSGPSHLAAAVGVPTLVLYGPTDPTVWRPTGPKVATIHRPDWADLTVEDVCQALRRLIVTEQKLRQ